MKKWYTCTILMLALSFLWEDQIFAQNLIPNGDFEDLLSCPDDEGQLDRASMWSNPSGGTPDLFNRCAGIGPCTPCVPMYFWYGNQEPQSGDGFTGMFTYWIGSSSEVREYLRSELTQPLLAGQDYQYTMYVNFADGSGSSTVAPQVHISIDDYTSGWIGRFNQIPQIDFDTTILDRNNWVELSTCFTAEGGERFITIGNFRSNIESQHDTIGPNEERNPYYLIDNVSLIQLQDTLNLLSRDTFLCPGNEITLSIGPDFSLPVLDYLWSTGATSPSIMVSNPGMYWLEVNTSCGVFRDSIEVTLGELPFIDLPDRIFICEGGDVIIEPAQDGGVITWSDGSMQDSFIINTPGWHWGEITNECGSARDSVFAIEVSEPPNVLPEDTTICKGDTVWLFAPTETNPIWQNTVFADSFPVFSTDTISLFMSNICGILIDVMAVHVEEQPFVALGQDQVICDGDSVLLQPEIVGDQWIWQDGSEDSLRWVKTSGQYWIEVENYCGVVRDSINVRVEASPSSTLPPDTSICEGQAWAVTYPQNYEVMWQDGSTDNEYIISRSGQYIVDINTPCGQISDTVNVSITDLPMYDLGMDTAFCAGQSLILNYDGPSAWIWSDASMDRELEIRDPGSYWIILGNECGTASDTINVFVDSMPTIQLEGDFEICDGQLDTLTVISNQSSWSWQDGSSDESLIISEGGIYTVVTQNACGVATDSIMITSKPLPVFDQLTQDVTVCAGDSVLLEASSANGQIEWFDGSMNDQVLVADQGVYSVITINECGETEVEIEVTWEDCGCPVFVPSAFSPNGDNINDRVRPLGDCPYETYEFRMFDRWGELVFFTQDRDQGWDGTFSGEPLHSGVFTYYFQYQIGSTSYHKTGTVTLVK